MQAFNCQNQEVVRRIFDKLLKDIRNPPFTLQDILLNYYSAVKDKDSIVKLVKIVTKDLFRPCSDSHIFRRLKNYWHKAIMELVNVFEIEKGQAVSYMLEYVFLDPCFDFTVSMFFLLIIIT